MNKTNANYKIQMLTNKGYETFLYTDCMNWHIIIHALKESYWLEGYRVLGDRNEVIYCHEPLEATI
jgi:hypothetical protein